MIDGSGHVETVRSADVRELIVSTRDGTLRVAVAFKTTAGALGRRATTRRAHALASKLVLEGAPLFGESWCLVSGLGGPLW